MKYKYSRLSRLLRLAPWADLDEIREDLIEQCKSIAQEYPSYDKHIKDIERFDNGEVPTLPDRMRFHYALSSIVRMLYGNLHDNDAMWTDAKSELIRYFFFHDFWEEQ
jgi:hypothetical protein